MIQVDIFWSFAMGACFAACASDGLKLSNSATINKYFVFTVVFLGTIFGPSGIYLLWHHTGWETMFMLDRSLHGIWPALFATTNVTQGILGFLLAFNRIKAGQELSAHTLWVVAYCCMFSILLFGYDRFLYAGTLDEWNRGVKYDILEFFQSEIFFTLLGMAIFLLPPIYYTMIVWPAEFGITGATKARLLRHAIITYVKCTVGFSLVYGLLHTFSGGQISGVDLGIHRLIAYVIGQVILGVTLFGPLTFIPVQSEGAQKRH